MMGITYLVRFIRYRHFPSVPGKLLASTVTEALVADSEGNGRTYLAVISYSYSVDGQRFTSSNVFSLSGSGSYGHISRGLAQRLCDELAAQRPLPVFYDPARPDVAFLRNGPLPLAVILPVSIGIIFVVIGVCIR